MTLEESYFFSTFQFSLGETDITTESLFDYFISWVSYYQGNFDQKGKKTGYGNKSLLYVLSGLQRKGPLEKTRNTEQN